ncbi:MAG: cysteine desulfurase, partial [Saprospiraceae bacterium]|nr:cysteine desulfurase [Saprospiraceae bacterium]
MYLDSAATTQKPQEVIDAIAKFYSSKYGTVHRGLYDLSSSATRDFENTRNLIAQFIDARSSSEIIYTSGATESINLVAHSYLRPLLRAGDEVIISIMEHHANFVPWQQLVKEKNATLRIVPVSENGQFDLGVYKKYLTRKTRFVAVTHVSNVTGVVNPVRQIVDLAHEVGAHVLVDGAQSIAHMPLSMQGLDCDFFAFSGHKLYGPTGVGVLYGKKALLHEMIPYRYGGEMILEVKEKVSTFKPAPHRFEAGTPNIAGVVGLGAAIRFILDLT